MAGSNLKANTMSGGVPTAERSIVPTLGFRS
jgi:hypothetical protein